MEISRTFYVPNITDWCCQQDETHTKYADLSNVACDIFCMLPQGVRVEASFSLQLDVMYWRQSKPTGDTQRKKVSVTQFTSANNGIFIGYNPVSDAMNTENYSAMKKDGEEMKLHSMANVHNVLEMWQACPNFHATQRNLTLKTSSWQL